VVGGPGTIEFPPTASAAKQQSLAAVTIGNVVFGEAWIATLDGRATLLAGCGAVTLRCQKTSHPFVRENIARGGLILPTTSWRALPK
jgi:hypothetical protein